MDWIRLANDARRKWDYLFPKVCYLLFTEYRRFRTIKSNLVEWVKAKLKGYIFFKALNKFNERFKRGKVSRRNLV